MSRIFSEPRYYLYGVLIVVAAIIMLYLFSIQTRRAAAAEVTHDRPGCRATDWRDHWKTDAERYCYSDYLRIFNAIASDVIVTDARTVAEAWCRTNYSPPAPSGRAR
jgi:hypothetical protein